MTPRIQRDDARPRAVSRGRAYVYVAPCRFEDILKLGFSRDPLDRFQTLHRRYYEFFDLDRALLIELDSVKEARGIEQRLGSGIIAHSAPAPLIIPPGAAGHTEWYRGAYDVLAGGGVADCLREGHTVHVPVAPWLRHRLLQQGDRLYGWCDQMLDAIGQHGGDNSPAVPLAPLERTLVDALDAYAALDIPLAPLVTPRILNWHATARRRSRA
ncbi:GIY-YIG nuclease family protein [Tahibacter amnicola]|uniref:GIY-YIG nuclease family protein n=1 Tax=Tahibacter amnicola TaxID=2976241 RepID=A0ABY6BB29_9GAMM|nr:GIY-YIG nuclease family protein [Tahibacter amnicola]UXI66358.1 GIY-YIG nuclease family protein [Tahibacter amnicola]